MSHTTRECSDLAVEVARNSHTLAGGSNAGSNVRRGHVVHSGEEAKVFAGAQAAIETFVASGVVSNLATGGSGRAFDIVGRDGSVTASRKNEGGQNTEKRRFAGTVRPHNCNCLSRGDRK